MFLVMYDMRKMHAYQCPDEVLHTAQGLSPSRIRKQLLSPPFVVFVKLESYIQQIPPVVLEIMSEC